MATFRVSMDIGGTFTDVIAYNVASGEIQAAKASTTPGELSVGVLKGLESLVSDLKDIEFLVHGTTQGLNAFLERRGVRVLLLATAGVEDTYLIARGPRLDLYNAKYRKPKPLVERKDIVGIGGRLGSQGEEVRPLDEAAIRQAARQALTEGYGAVAVAFLFSYKNPEHELHAGAILREELGDEFTISLSHQAAKEWREYERTSSAVVEAYTGPVVRNYLLALEEQPNRRGVKVPLHIMQSSGGVLTARSARERPLQTLLSGPVGGAMGDVELARLSDRKNLIGVDMGGTSFDVSLVVDGHPDVSTEAVLEGLPMLMSVVNIHTVGSGGGSVAWLEAGGLRVGPRSAGAKPGPACYGRGGTEPTVTDANLVLGRVDAEWFAGGNMTLDKDAAVAALKTVGNPLGLDPIAIAEGICNVANAQMAGMTGTGIAGVPSGIPLGVGSGDNAAAALALGLVEEEAVLSLGTSGVVYTRSSRPVHDYAGYACSYADATGDHLPIVATLNAARSLEVAADLLGSTLAELSNLALHARPGAEGLTLLPYFEGERTPDLPHARGSLHGASLTNFTRANFARAVVEGTLASQIAMLDALRACGLRTRRVSLIGGAAQSPAIRAVLAQLVDIPVVVPDHDEYVAKGAAMQAAGALQGEFRTWPVTSTELAPQPFEPAALVQHEAAKAALAY